MQIIKVSFDYDGTLQDRTVQKYAKELMNKGIDVWVVTTRYDKNYKHKYPINPSNDDLLWNIDNLEIPRWKVRFTNMEWKYTYIKGTQFIWHLDDNKQEKIYADKHLCKVPIIDVCSKDFKIQCNNLLGFTKR